MVGSFLKVPPVPRTKTVDSLIEKAYYRGKGYQNPYDDVTDKVGTRFVVLLLADIVQIQTVLEGSRYWDASKDRDFEEERRQRPTLFDYQSVHYVVRSKGSIQAGEREFPPGLPCEVQIRTLMQHAFSELTHDTVYKPDINASPLVLRDVAKSMALIETTDHLFSDVSMRLQEMSSASDQWVRELESLYESVVGREAATAPRANAFLLNALRQDWTDVTVSQVTDFVQSEPVARWVREKADEHFLFRQPTVLLVYFLARRKRISLQQHWPFTRTELEPIYTDLGQSLGDG
jgi:ppGpp synthetase/RelA/SpoT-type nucleotidyltranferase